MISHKSNSTKYNFNNDKGTPEVFGLEDGDESWETLNNSGVYALWQSADYSGNGWLSDYEARYPEDNTNPTNLQALATWIVSTDQSKATGATLSPSYTDVDGNVYTKDNAAYRVAKFRTEAKDHFEMDSLLFYYLFTELFLMVDSRAKNAFPSFLSGDKWCFLPYDMDTAIGIDNQGALTYGYSLEDIDKVGTENVFNGQNSVLWINVRAAFYNELASMYSNLRSSGALSYNLIESMFETHQNKWAEAIFNEDAWFKYIDPLVDDGNANYLSMALGSKAEQRKWWLYNRFRYIDSKYSAGDTLTDYIMIRPGAIDDGITITPYADIYASIKWDNDIAIERATHGEPVTIDCPYTQAGNNVVSILNASQLASVGDLSGFKCRSANFAMASRLQYIKVGDGASGYENPNLLELNVGNNALLSTVDARNCTSLTMPIDLSGATNIENALFDGTAITSVSLPIGGILKKLHLPSTITNLTIRNQPSITEFYMPSYSNITTLRIENCSNAVPINTILSAIPTNSRVRIIGFTATMSTTSAVEAFYDRLDTMRGLDENGGNLDKAVVSGTITGLGDITGAWLAEMYERYPNITIEYEHITSNLYYYNYDGSTLLNTETIVDGGNGTYSGTPSRTATAQYTFTFVGWSLEQDAQTADSNATKNVSADRNIYAAYSRTLRSYTVYWRNADNTLLETDTNVNYGSMPQYNGATPTYQGRTSIGWSPSVSSVVGDVTYTATYVPTYQVNFYNDNGTTLLQTVTVEEGSTAVYTGATPTSSEDASLEWLGWAIGKNAHKADAVLTNIQSNMTVYAAFKDAVEVAEITDSWDTIIDNIDNGTYSTKYKVGNYKPLDLGTEGTINMQIVAMDADYLQSGDTVPLTFIAIELLQSQYNGGLWYSSTGGLRKTLNDTVINFVPNNVRNRLQPVYKSYMYKGKQYGTYNKLWIPSLREICQGQYQVDAETSGPSYASSLYPVEYSSPNRIKSRPDGTNLDWWLRSLYTGDNVTVQQFYCTKNNGSPYFGDPWQSKGVCLGFCLGLETETITDDWATILANESPSTSYSIGDTKMLDLGTEGKHLMEIVAFDEDDKADGTGKAKITWISKDLLVTTHKMNPAKVANTEGTGTLGGWEKSEMRTYLKETIKPLIPETVRNAIVPVTKVSNAYQASDETAFQQTTVDDVWIPSHREVFNSTSYDNTGAVYSDKFKDASSRIKKRNGFAYVWWLRSAGGTLSFNFVASNGDGSINSVTYAFGVDFGFCTD